MDERRSETLCLASSFQVRKVAAVMAQTASGLNRRQAKYWTEHGGELQEELGRIFKRADAVFARSDWENFYRNVFGKEVSFTHACVPEYQRRFDPVIFVAEGIGFEKIISVCRQKLQVELSSQVANDIRCYNDSGRLKEGSYAIRIADAFSQYNKTRAVSSFLEYLLFILKKFAETGEHPRSTGNILFRGVGFATSFGCRWERGKLRIYCYDTYDGVADSTLSLGIIS